MYIFDHNCFPQIGMKTKGSSANMSDLLTVDKQKHEELVCSPHRHIFYLKVAKTGSSTLTNVLNRNALLFNTRLCRIHKAVTFHSELRNNKSADDRFKCELHTTPTLHYSSDIVHQYMSRDTISIGILRFPFNNFRSKYYFFQKKRKRFSPVDLEGDAIETILKNSEYDPRLKHYVLKGTYRELQNCMYNYFQLDDIKAMSDEKYFQDSITKVEQEFPLIFINEYYDESLVLFKRKVCWEMKDILYITHKKASYVNKAKTPEEYGALFDRHKNISSIDYKFYDHFLHVHKRHVQNSGNAFAEEVLAFKRVNIETSNFCWDIFNKLETGTDFETTKALAQKELIVEQGRFNPRFKVMGGDCILMALSEEVFIKAVRAVNYPHHCEKEKKVPQVDLKFCSVNKEEFVYQNIPFNNVKKTLMKDIVV